MLYILSPSVYHFGECVHNWLQITTVVNYRQNMWTKTCRNSYRPHIYNSNDDNWPAPESDKSISWLSSEELRECVLAPASGRRGNAGPVSCTDDVDNVVTAFLSLVVPVYDDESWPAGGGGGSCVGPGTVAQQNSEMVQQLQRKTSFVVPCNNSHRIHVHDMTVTSANFVLTCYLCNSFSHAMHVSY